MSSDLSNAKIKIKNILEEGLTIYDTIEVGDPNLWLTGIELEVILKDKLLGTSLHGLPNKTKSKRAKGLVCSSLGFAIPKSFKKLKPRFTAIGSDLHVQQSNNLQIWNAEIDPVRRYIIMLLDENSNIKNIKVIIGAELETLDNTGTLTQKYQARLLTHEPNTELISPIDTPTLQSLFPLKKINSLVGASPTDEPTKDTLMGINDIFKKIKTLEGFTFKDVGKGQDRNRGAVIHSKVCELLGYDSFKDNGQFPDIRHQLLEIKLQTKATIDLGLVTPSSLSPLDIEKIRGVNIKHCDVRYAIFYGVVEKGIVKIQKIYLTTGADFFSRFPQCQGNIKNTKIQLILPKSYFVNQVDTPV